MQDIYSKWEKGKIDEIYHQVYNLIWIKEGGRSVKNENEPFPEYLKKFIDLKSKKISVLEVGCGPICFLGTNLPGYKVNITAADPLADKYNKIIEKYKLEPDIKVLNCAAENLDTLFEKNSFDIAIAQNSLDHSYNPLLGIKQMLETVKPGCYVILCHNINEATRSENKYCGLHQWNFDIENNNFIIWNYDIHIIVNEELKNIAVVDSEIKYESNIKILWTYIKKK